MSWEVISFENSLGNSPVEKAMNKLSGEENAALAVAIEALGRFGPNLGREYPGMMEHIKGSRWSDLYELKIKKPRQIRIMLWFDEKRKEAVLLEVYDKTRSPNKKDQHRAFDRALARLKDHWSQTERVN